MKIGDIYEKYQITQNLREHMIRVASVGALIADHWKNKKEIDRKNLVTALLLHDMGNIVKFTFNENIYRHSPKELEFIKKLKENFIHKYGPDEHEVTEKIAREIGVNEVVMNLLSRKGQSFTYIALHSNDPNKKIKSYSDFRVGPHGVITINERFDDLYTRYKGIGHFWSDAKNVESRREWALELEKQIQEKADFDLQKINDASITEYFVEISNFEI